MRLLHIVAALVLLVPVAAAAQAYPAKPVHMIVGFPPGGGTDILARILAQRLSDAWGQQVVVENRPGASATIAANAVARAAADGYTLSMGQLTPNAIAPALYPKLPYDALKDFAPIVLVGTSPNVLVTSGAGSLQHIAAELFKSVAGIDLVHIPFKGSG
jgi:tripartite-type tricarboxylate transporter receptor subunit TctC